jgi:hypothetical protein
MGLNTVAMSIGYYSSIVTGIDDIIVPVTTILL